MGREKYQKAVEELFRKSPVVQASSIARIIRSKNNVRQYAKQLIRNLILKGKIKPLAKGYYTVHDDPSLSVFCFKPAYLGLQDALSFHNLWEQETVPVIVTSAKARQGIREMLGANVLVRRLDKRYMFGFGYDNCNTQFYLPYSDVEKTLIDMVYFRQRMSSETRNQLLKRLDKRKLHCYLVKYPERLRKRIVSFIAAQSPSKTRKPF